MARTKKQCKKWSVKRSGYTADTDKYLDDDDIPQGSKMSKALKDEYNSIISGKAISAKGEPIAKDKSTRQALALAIRRINKQGKKAGKSKKRK